MLLALIIISVFIFIGNFILLKHSPKFKQITDNLPSNQKLSIVIAFKNEEKNLEGLFSSLKNQDYPRENFEIILVDDSSTDKSYQIAAELSKSLPNCRVIIAAEKRYPRKRGALDLGIKEAKNQFILITDADCIPEPNWIKGYSIKFIEGYDLLFGLAPFFQSSSFVNNISCFENLRSSLLTFSSANMSMPYSAAARNIGFRKECFYRIGGFGNTLLTPSGDDDLLIREAVKNNLKIGVVDFKGSSVFSFTKNSLRDYLNQKGRHVQTSFHYLFIHKALLSIWHISNLVIVFSTALIFLNLAYLLPIFIKLLSDVFCVIRIQKSFKYKFRLDQIIIHQVLYEIFLTVNFLSSLRKNIAWKS